MMRKVKDKTGNEDLKKSMIMTQNQGTNSVMEGEHDQQEVDETYNLSDEEEEDA